MSRRRRLLMCFWGNLSRPNKTSPEIILVEPAQRGRCKGRTWGEEGRRRGRRHRGRPPISHPRPCARSKKNFSLPSGRALKHFSCTHGPPGRRPGAAEGGRAKARPPGRRLWGTSENSRGTSENPRETSENSRDFGKLSGDFGKSLGTSENPWRTSENPRGLRKITGTSENPRGLRKIQGILRKIIRGLRTIIGGLRKIQGGLRKIHGGLRKIHGGLRKIHGDFGKSMGDFSKFQGLRKIQGGLRKIHGGLRKIPGTSENPWRTSENPRGLRKIHGGLRILNVYLCPYNCLPTPCHAYPLYPYLPLLHSPVLAGGTTPEAPTVALTTAKVQCVLLQALPLPKLSPSWGRQRRVDTYYTHAADIKR